jgi:site-specific recombinase XerD
MKTPANAANFMSRVFLPALAAAKIENLHWHDLRHTFASRLVMAGVPLYTVSKLLGHTSFAMTQRYAHLAPGHLLDAVRHLDASGTRSGTSIPARSAGSGASA